jgi:hypothetical protein
VALLYIAQPDEQGELRQTGQAWQCDYCGRIASTTGVDLFAEGWWGVGGLHLCPEHSPAAPPEPEQPADPAPDAADARDDLSADDDNTPRTPPEGSPDSLG